MLPEGVAGGFRSGPGEEVVLGAVALSWGLSGLEESREVDVDDAL